MTMGTEPRWTPGPWEPPHLSDDSTPCNCRSIVEGEYAGGIATVHVDNGIALISEGGNDCPPLEEAKANGLLIAAAPELYAQAEMSCREMEMAADQLDRCGFASYADDLRLRVRAVREAMAKARGEVQP